MENLFSFLFLFSLAVLFIFKHSTKKKNAKMKKKIHVKKKKSTLPVCALFTMNHIMMPHVTFFWAQSSSKEIQRHSANWEWFWWLDRICGQFLFRLLFTSLAECQGALSSSCRMLAFIDSSSLAARWAYGNDITNSKIVEKNNMCWQKSKDSRCLGVWKFFLSSAVCTSHRDLDSFLIERKLFFCINTASYLQSSGWKMLSSDR